jgi:hypothetical protein
LPGKYGPPSSKPQLVLIPGDTLFVRGFKADVGCRKSDPGGLRALVGKYEFQKYDGIARQNRGLYWELSPCKKSVTWEFFLNDFYISRGVVS